MNVSLTPELERLIQERVASGMYGNASEVVREALRMLFEKEVEKRRAMDELKHELDIGYQQILRGEVVETTVEEIFNEALNRYDNAQYTEAQ
jgi:antitoxin ParD1/3/4